MAEDSFQWSLKPLIMCMKFLGIKLDSAKSSKSFLVKVRIPFLGLLIALLNVTVNHAVFIGKLNFMRLAGDSENAAEFFKKEPDGLIKLAKNVIIILLFSLAPVVHLIFISNGLMARKWDIVWYILQKIQSNLHRGFHRKCRKHCFVVLGLLVLDGAAMTKRFQLYLTKYVYIDGAANALGSRVLEGLVSYDQQNYLRFHEKYVIVHPQLPLIAAVWSRLAEIAVRISFVALTWTVTLLFENLGEELETLLKNYNSDSDDEQRMVGKMKEWIRQYDLTCQLVEKMNRFFGIILIIVVAGDFAYSVMQSCEILENFIIYMGRSGAMRVGRPPDRYEHSEWCIWDLPYTVIRNLLILVSAYRVDSSGSGLSGTFAQFSYSSNPTVNGVVNSMLIKVSQIPAPKTTAANVFELKLSNMFTLIDNALQWGAIIYLATVVGTSLKHQLDCIAAFHLEGYHGCFCFGDRLHCESMTLNEVRSTLQRMKEKDIPEFLLQVPIRQAIVTIPADLLSTNRVIDFKMVCSSVDEPYELRIDADALRASRNSLKELSIRACDLRFVDFSFLDGFELLEDLKFFYSLGIYESIPTLPWLPNMTSLSFTQMPSLAMSKKFPELNRSLETFALVWSDIDDIFMDLVLQWVANTSENTLTTLDIRRNALTHIPHQISNLKSLKNLWMDDQTNAHHSFQPNMTIIHSKLEYDVSIRSCGIQCIQPGAFQGSFKNVIIRLEDNNLTRFESSVFEDMLQHMASTTGMLLLNENPFDCSQDPCHLAWLIRNNRELLASLSSASCSNGTPFDHLNPNALTHCP